MLEGNRITFGQTFELRGATLPPGTGWRHPGLPFGKGVDRTCVHVGRSCSLLAAWVLAAAPAAAQSRDSSQLVPTYHTVAFHYAIRNQFDESELFISVGRAFAIGAGGPWMVRIDGGAGMSLYGSIRDIGYLAGIRPSLVRVMTGEYLDVGVPVELYATAGAGAFADWNLSRTEDPRSVMPLVSLGAGFRFRGLEQLGMLELLWERPLGVWPARLTWRLGVHWPKR